MDRRLLSQCGKIESTIRIAEAEYRKDNDDVVSGLSKLLCVQVAGFLENGITIPLERHAEKHSSPKLHKFLFHYLNKFQNPNSDKMIELLQKFDLRWSDDLIAFMDVDGRKEAVDSIMSRRHQIAHGEDAGIGLATVRQYYGKCKEVILYFDKMVVQ